MKNCTPQQLERVDWIQKQCIDILKKEIQQDSLKYITAKSNEYLSTQKLTTFEIRDYLFSCQDSAKSICLYIQKKMNVLEIFHLLVRTLKMNNDNYEAKVCDILANFIRKLTDLFFIVIGRKHQQNVPWSRCITLKKTGTYIFTHVLTTG